MASLVRRALLVAAIATLVLELGVRTFGPRLGDPLPFGLASPLDWLHADYQRLVGEMDELQTRGEELDLVLVGTSMVMIDLRDDVLADGWGSIDRIGNLAAPDATAAIAQRWLLEEVIPRTRPERVIWGVSSMDFNSSRNRLGAYESTRRGATGLFGELDRLIGDLSAVSRYRELLRSPGAVLDVIRRPPPDPDYPQRTSLNSAPFSPAARTPAAYDQIVGFLSSYRVEEAELAALGDTSVALGDLGIELVVVLMPVPSEYISAHPGGVAQFDEWRKWIVTEADRLGIPLLDHSRSLPDEAFPDFTHLGAEGAEELSLMVVEELVRLGW